MMKSTDDFILRDEVIVGAVGLDRELHDTC